MNNDSDLINYNIVKDFLVEHGDSVHKVKDKSFLSFHYQDEFTNIIFGEYMNGQGSYISSDSMFIVYYHNTGILVQKKGDKSELEQLAKRFIPVGKIKKLIAL